MQPCDVCSSLISDRKLPPGLVRPRSVPVDILPLIIIFFASLIFSFIQLHRTTTALSASLLRRAPGQTLMNVALRGSPAAPRLTASTRWDPTRASGRSSAAAAITPVPTGPDASVGDRERHLRLSASAPSRGFDSCLSVRVSRRRGRVSGQHASMWRGPTVPQSAWVVPLRMPDRLPVRLVQEDVCRYV